MGEFQPLDRLVLAAPRVLQPSHAVQVINTILLDDSVVEAINSGQKDLSSISIPVSVISVSFLAFLRSLNVRYDTFANADKFLDCTVVEVSYTWCYNSFMKYHFCYEETCKEENKT